MATLEEAKMDADELAPFDALTDVLRRRALLEVFDIGEAYATTFRF